MDPACPNPPGCRTAERLLLSPSAAHSSLGGTLVLILVNSAFKMRLFIASKGLRECMQGRGVGLASLVGNGGALFFLEAVKLSKPDTPVYSWQFRNVHAVTFGQTVDELFSQLGSHKSLAPPGLPRQPFSTGDRKVWRVLQRTGSPHCCTHTPELGASCQCCSVTPVSNHRRRRR